MSFNYSARLALAAAACLLATGCTRTLPIVEHIPTCPISEGQLAQECQAPSALSPGATFSDLVDLAMNDRKALADCTVAQNALRESVRACNKRIAEANRQIDAINEKK